MKEGIYHPIKLEYYKITNELETVDKSKTKFGVEIVKKEYKKEGTKVENEEVQYVTNNEKEVEEVLRILEKGEATPINLKYIIEDIMV